jgi:hypothetical protein
MNGEAWKNNEIKRDDKAHKNKEEMKIHLGVLGFILSHL